MNPHRKVHCAYCGPRHQTKAERKANPGRPLWTMRGSGIPPARNLVRLPNGMECCARCATDRHVLTARQDEARNAERLARANRNLARRRAKAA